MSCTIRRGGKKPAVHHCALPPFPDEFQPGTRISCDVCGQWYKLAFDGGGYGWGYYKDRVAYWQRIRRIDRSGVI